MSNGSREQELPLERRCQFCGDAASHKCGRHQACDNCCVMHGESSENKELHAWIGAIGMKYHAALAQIATLTAQMKKDVGAKERLFDQYIMERNSRQDREAELAALREGIGVEQYLSMKVRAEAAESKLRADSCKHCGPNCIPGAAHNAREEDGVTWEADATGGEG